MKNVRKGYYSPVLRRDLVRGLYFKARELGVPMTVLNDRIVEEALQCVTAIQFPSPKQPQMNIFENYQLLLQMKKMKAVTAGTGVLTLLKNIRNT